MCVFVCVSAFCMFVFGRSIRSPPLAVEPYLCIFSVRPNYRTSIDNGIDLNIPGPPTKAPAPNSHEKARAKPQTQCIRKTPNTVDPMHTYIWLLSQKSCALLRDHIYYCYGIRSPKTMTRMAAWGLIPSPSYL